MQNDVVRLLAAVIGAAAIAHVILTFCQMNAAGNSAAPRTVVTLSATLVLMVALAVASLWLLLTWNPNQDETQIHDPVGADVYDGLLLRPDTQSYHRGSSF